MYLKSSMLEQIPLIQLTLITMLHPPLGTTIAHRRIYDAKQYTHSNIPLWKQRACEKPQTYKADLHYICDKKGDVKCLPGWQGDLCQVPLCRKGCDPMNGYCQRPGECRCRIGYTGDLCDRCIPLPGCQHGTCTKPFECLCQPGWDGLFCTEPICRSGCHSTRGYCEGPGECRCRIGWAGRTCSECSVMPGCQHGTCTKPLECTCLPGYTGLLCQTPFCASDCNKQHGYCRKPGECRCKIGWTGDRCDKCFPYPGCVHGDCETPWECNCQAGWGGMLCDERLTFCVDNPNICENGGRCQSLSKEDGSFRCLCKQGYLGKNCEIVDEYMLTSTAAPRITPPPPPDAEVDRYDAQVDEDIDAIDLKTTSTTLRTTSIDYSNKTVTMVPLTLTAPVGAVNETHPNDPVIKSPIASTTSIVGSILLPRPETTRAPGDNGNEKHYNNSNEILNLNHILSAVDDSEKTGHVPEATSVTITLAGEMSTKTTSTSPSVQFNEQEITIQQPTNPAPSVNGKPTLTLTTQSLNAEDDVNGDGDGDDDDDEDDEEDEDGDDDDDNDDDGDEDGENEETDQFIPNIFDNLA